MLLQLRDEELGESQFSLPFKHESFSQSRDRIVLDVELYGGVLTLTNKQKWIWLHYIGGGSQDYIAVIKLVVQAMGDVVNQFSKMAGISFPYICFPCPSCVNLMHPCSFNKRHDSCICTIDRSKMMPISYEMYNILEAVKDVVGM